MKPYFKVAIITILSLMSFVPLPARSDQKQTMVPIPMKKLTLVFPVSKETALGKWVNLIYTEAFRRLNMEFEFVAYPGKRASLAADDGQVDGEFIRVYTYGGDHPNLIRVEEAVLSVRFAAFATDPSIRLRGWDDLRGTDYKVEYMLGIKRCKEKLSGVVRPENLYATNNAVQGIEKLILGRADIYVNSELFIRDILKSKKFASSSVRYAGLLEEIPHYLYLHNKHRELAPKFSEVFKAMKEEGLIEKYRSAVVNE